MFKHRARFAMPLVAFAALAVPQLGAAEIRDRAGIFTAEAIKKAETVLDRIERRTKIPVVIETIEAIPGLDRDASATEKRRAVEQLAEKRAREIGYEGVYLLISKNDRVFSRVLVKERFDSLLPREKRQEVLDTLAREFKGGRFDEGLRKTTALLDSALAEAPAVSGLRRAVPGMPAPRRGDAHEAKFGLGTLFAIGL
ncbi:MAG: TPM domain-containing protein, partial [Isosphaeraceae bacterium]